MERKLANLKIVQKLQALSESNVFWGMRNRMQSINVCLKEVPKEKEGRKLVVVYVWKNNEYNYILTENINHNFKDHKKTQMEYI